MSAKSTENLRWPRSRCRRVAAAWLVAAFLTACSAASRYEVLRFFFDGVPDPSAPVPSVKEQQPLVRTVRPEVTPAVVLHMHEPYAKRQCEACHKGAVDKTRRTTGAFAISSMSELVMPVERLCITCHEPSAAAFQHAPALLGDCVRCHDPHSSRFDHLLHQEKSALLCATCHTEDTMPTRAQHAAHGDRDCAECHDPHASAVRFLLRPAAAVREAAPAQPEAVPEPGRRGGR